MESTSTEDCNSSVPSALFVFSIVHYYREMLPVAQYFRDQGWQICVTIGWVGEGADAAVADCERHGFVVDHQPTALCYGGETADYLDDAWPNVSLSMWERLRRFLLWPMAHKRNRLGMLKPLWWSKDYAHDLLERHQPNVVFSGPYQCCGKVDNAISLACRQLGIRNDCLPVFEHLGEQNSVEGRFDNVENGMLPKTLVKRKSLFHFLLGRLFRDWTRTRRGWTIFCWNPRLMFYAWLEGLLEPGPWQKPSVQFHCLFVESEISRRMLLDSNYPAEKIVLSGKPLLDQVIADASDPRHQHVVYDELDLPHGEPFLLCNVEPSFEHCYASFEEHWDRFHGLMRCLQNSGMPVVLSLHPICDAKNYNFVERQYGVRIARQRKIVELYPHAAIVVSFCCSTNAMADIFGRPLVIYDFVGMTKRDNPRSGQYRLPNAKIAYDTGQLRDVIEATLADRQPGESIETTPPHMHGKACGAIFEEVRHGLGRSTSPQRQAA